MSEKILVTVNGKPRLAVAGLTLSEIINGEKPCGGHGKCGKCKVVAKGEISAPSESELELITADELSDGVRLACLTRALGDCEVCSVLDAETAQIMTEGALTEFEVEPSFSEYGVAVDIGTTTIAASLYDASGNLLSKTACLNPQSEWGADVISRIEAALDTKAQVLAQSVRTALNKIISELADAAHISTEQIDGAVITGNTVMLHLLTEESVEPLSHAPFEAKRLFGETLSAFELSISCLKPDTEVYLPPCISAFVGADITCAIEATGLFDRGAAVLVDIGTNGEMALWNGNELSVCSTAAGPAFEGVGISMGMRGSCGAIDKVSLVNGRLFSHVIGEGKATGICGSGLIDAVACLLGVGELDESGLLEDEPCVIGDGVSLTQDDIRMVQLAKSAICAGMLTLVKNASLSVSDLEAVYIAGGFGNYLNVANAERVGLLPRGTADKSKAVGNAALGGASVLLLAPRFRAECDELVKKVSLLELSTDKVFSDLYIQGMFFE